LSLPGLRLARSKITLQSNKRLLGRVSHPASRFSFHGLEKFSRLMSSNYSATAMICATKLHPYLPVGSRWPKRESKFLTLSESRVVYVFWPRFSILHTGKLVNEIIASWDTAGSYPIQNPSFRSTHLFVLHFIRSGTAFLMPQTTRDRQSSNGSYFVRMVQSSRRMSCFGYGWRSKYGSSGSTRGINAQDWPHSASPDFSKSSSTLAFIQHDSHDSFNSQETTVL
jgi:hypothetical protein